MAKFLKRGKMMSDVVDSALANAVLEEAIDNGSLVVLGDLLADTTYAATGDYEYDLYEAAAPEAATDEVVLVDYAGISEGAIQGNEYKIGIKLYDLEVPAGTATRVRRPYLHDKFWLADGNFNGTPVVGEYAIAEANAYTHKPAAALPQAGYAVKVLVEKDVTAGMATVGKMYLVEVVQL